jgi:serine/threonine protein kinase
MVKLEIPMPDEHRTDVVCFGSFELDLGSGELYSNGRKIPLQEQGFRILKLLTESPGRLVAREEIRKRLWPNDTVVEFENAVNSAIKKLRIALSDSAEDPRYIETIKRRGYRLMVPVEYPATGEADSSGVDGKDQQPVPGWAGRRVSHYRVLEMLGGGGMGLVYRAEDVRLGRRVALKFVPDELAGNPKMLERLRYEACSASALNHPNICTIYEIEEQAGVPFIVMELLEGSTLRDRISTGALPAGELVEYALQIADGLDAAHQKSIIHRDIKPTNIFITKDGRVKILDFGLAKFAEARQETGVPRDSMPFHTFPRSSPSSIDISGIFSGTPSYMSPEQRAGEALDTRTDLFSFGLALRDMATGPQVFARYVPAVEDPSLNGSPTTEHEFNSGLPPELAAIIAKAAQADRRVRYQTASEMRQDLLRLKEHINSPQPVVPRKPTLRVFGNRGRWLVAGIGAATVLAVVLLFTRIGTRREVGGKNELRMRQLTTSSAENFVQDALLSPDGNYLLFADQINIHLRLLATGESHEFPKPKALSTSDAWLPAAWFPDGTRFVAVSQQLTPHGQVTSTWIVNVFNGESRLLREDAFAQSVSPDGSRIAFTSGGLDMDGEIWVMERSGENARRITPPVDDTVGFQVVRWSPDNRNLAYLRRSNRGFFSWSIEIRGVDGGAPATLVSKASRPAWLIWMPDNRVVFAADEPPPGGHNMNLWAIDVRPDGKPQGRPRKLTNLVDFHLDRLSISRDGTKMSAVNSSTLHDVYVAELQKNGAMSVPRRLTLEDSNDYPLDWTPDSKAVIFVSDRSGIFNIFKQPIDEPVAVPMTTGPNVNIMARVSPDGRWLVYMSRHPGFVPTANLMRVPINGGPPQFIRKCSAVTDLACPRLPATECVASEVIDEGRIYTAFDPITGSAHELFRMNFFGHRGGGAGLSPDGSQFLFITRSPRETTLRFGSWAGKPLGEFKLTGWSNLNSADWAADGKSIFISSGTPLGATLLRVDLQGRVQPLWQVWGRNGQSWGSGRTWAIPSPDGRRLALLGGTTHSNAWLLENF